MKRVVGVVAAVVVVAGPAGAQGGGWQVGTVPGGGDACTAAKPGAEVNTRLMRNTNGLMILVAARSDWSHTDPITAKLGIDGAAAKTVLAQTVGPLVLVLVDEPELEASLRAAKRLQWTLPWGVFNAEVDGLGTAYDEMSAC